jgi:hypothetical protein
VLETRSPATCVKWCHLQRMKPGTSAGGAPAKGGSCAGNTPAPVAVAELNCRRKEPDPWAPAAARRKARVCCQVRDCTGLDDSASSYFKRLRLCSHHAHAEEVLLDGELCRFCQKCNKLHLLGAFEGKKRACIEQLLRHNEARRNAQKKRHEAPGSGAPIEPTISPLGSMDDALVQDDLSPRFLEQLASDDFCLPELEAPEVEEPAARAGLRWALEVEPMALPLSLTLDAATFSAPQLSFHVETLLRPAHQSCCASLTGLEALRLTQESKCEASFHPLLQAPDASAYSRCAFNADSLTKYEEMRLLFQGFERQFHAAATAQAIWGSRASGSALGSISRGGDQPAFLQAALVGEAPCEVALIHVRSFLSCALRVWGKNRAVFQQDCAEFLPVFHAHHAEFEDALQHGLRFCVFAMALLARLRFEGSIAQYALACESVLAECVHFARGSMEAYSKRLAWSRSEANRGAFLLPRLSFQGGAAVAWGLEDAMRSYLTAFIG